MKHFNKPLSDWERQCTLKQSDGDTDEFRPLSRLLLKTTGCNGPEHADWERSLVIESEAGLLASEACIVVGQYLRRRARVVPGVSMSVSPSSHVCQFLCTLVLSLTVDWTSHKIRTLTRRRYYQNCGDIKTQYETDTQWVIRLHVPHAVFVQKTAQNRELLGL